MVFWLIETTLTPVIVMARSNDIIIAGKLALIFFGKFQLQSCSQYFGKQATNKKFQN